MSLRNRTFSIVTATAARPTNPPAARPRRGAPPGPARRQDRAACPMITVTFLSAELLRAHSTQKFRDHAFGRPDSAAGGHLRRLRGSAGNASQAALGHASKATAAISP